MIVKKLQIEKPLFEKVAFDAFMMRDQAFDFNHRLGYQEFKR